MQNFFKNVFYVENIIILSLNTIIHNNIIMGWLSNIATDRLFIAIFNLILLNPFMPNEISHHYQLDESISNIRVVG